MIQKRTNKKTTYQAKPKKHQDYNNIFQENLDEIAALLLTKVFSFDKLPTRPLERKKAYRTYSREPDILLAALDKNGEHVETLHGEIHRKDELEISIRMAEYGIMEYRRYRKPVRLFVLYIGEGEPKHISQQIEGGDVSAHIKVVSMQRIPVQTFLQSEKPEEVILGILADFQGRSPEEVIIDILATITKRVTEQESLNKYYRQLEILSNLRNLQLETTKFIGNMPLTYDIRTDLRFKEGRQEGRQEGLESGVILIIINLVLKSDHDDAFISAISGVEAAQVAQIRRIIKDYPKDYRKQIEKEVSIKPDLEGNA